MSRGPSTSDLIVDVALDLIEGARLNDLLSFLNPTLLARTSEQLNHSFTEADVRSAFPSKEHRRGFDRDALIDCMLFDGLGFFWVPTLVPPGPDEDFETTIDWMFKYLSDVAFSEQTGWHSLLLLMAATTDSDSAAAKAASRLDRRLFNDIYGDRRACFPASRQDSP